MESDRAPRHSTDGAARRGSGWRRLLAPARPGDRAPDLSSHLRVVLGCGGVLALLGGYAQDPLWLESRWIDGHGATLAVALARVSAWMPASAPVTAAEVLVAVLIAVTVWRGLDALAEVGAGRRRLRNALLGGAFHVSSVGFVLAAWFYLSWGLVYARAPLADRLGWPAAPDPAVTEARTEILGLAAYAIDRANGAYRQLHRTEDAGQPTAVPDPRRVDAQIEDGFVCAGRVLGAPATFAARRPPAKVPMGSSLLSWLGIGGIYVPFTGEAHVNGLPPAFSQVFTVAHEKAHQRLIGPEDEASFVGFLALACSPDPLLAYAGWEFAARQLLRPVAAIDRAEGTGHAAALVGRFLPGVRRDQQASRDFWAAYDGPMEAWSHWMNDHYLRAHSVQGGVLAYGRAGRLVASLLRTPEGQRLAGLPEGWIPSAPLPLTPPTEGSAPVGPVGSEAGGG